MYIFAHKVDKKANKHNFAFEIVLCYTLHTFRRYVWDTLHRFACLIDEACFHVIFINFFFLFNLTTILLCFFFFAVKATTERQFIHLQITYINVYTLYIFLSFLFCFCPIKRK